MSTLLDWLKEANAPIAWSMLWEANYNLEITFSLLSPEGAETIKETLALKMRHMDAEELLIRL